MNQPEEVLEVQVFEIHAKRLAGIAAAGAIARRGRAHRHGSAGGGRLRCLRHCLGQSLWLRLLLLLQCGINGCGLRRQTGVCLEWALINAGKRRSVVDKT